MNESSKFGDSLFSDYRKMNGVTYVKKLGPKQSLAKKFDEESFRCSMNPECATELLRPGGNWCDALSNVNAKQAWKSGTEKLSQTLNNVKSTFGSLSQKIRRSGRKGQPLINLDSPKSPATPRTRSKVVLGRTPTKLYSPFGIDTPIGKENRSSRVAGQCTYVSRSGNRIGERKKTKRTKLDLSANETISHGSETKFSSDLLQTQIGIYEFHSVANKITQNGTKK